VTAARYGDQLPWATFEAPGTVALWGGGYMKTYSFRGMDLASASMADRVHANERLNDVLRNLGDRWCWHIEGQQRRVRSYQRGTFPNAAADLVDAERAATFGAVDAQFRMDHFLSLSQTPPGALPMVITEALTSGQKKDARSRQRESFLAECDHIRRLMNGVVRVDEMSSDDVATYLHSTISTKRHRVRAADHGWLSETLADERFSRGLGLSKLGKNYAAFLTLGGFPPASSPNMLAAVSRLPFEFRWVSRWVGMSPSTARALLESRESRALGSVDYLKDMFVKKLFNATEKTTSVAPSRRNRVAEKHALEIGNAQTKLSDRAFGHMTTVFAVWDTDAKRCYEKRSALKSALQTAQLVVRDEIVEPVKVWRMSMPGNREMGRRTFPVSSRVCVDLAALDSQWAGRGYDKRLAAKTGKRRSWLQTADPSPFCFDTDTDGGAAHALLFGRTGKAGKSTFANHLGLLFQAHKDAHVVSLSIGRSELGPVLLSGGVEYRLGDASNPRPLQPLARLNAPGGQQQAASWVELWMDCRGVAMTPEDRSAVDLALALMASDVPKRWTITALYEDLSSRAPHLAEALRHATKAGHYGHLFDGNNAASFAQQRWTMFDISKLLHLDESISTPAFACVLSMINGWFDGRPTLLIFEECPQYLRFERLQRFVAMVLDTKRKEEVRALLIAQTRRANCSSTRRYSRASRVRAVRWSSGQSRKRTRWHPTSRSSASANRSWRPSPNCRSAPTCSRTNSERVSLR
jgi:type IV secretory pathway VirB4 component